MPTFLHLAGPFPDRHDILPSLGPAQIELIHRIQIFSSSRIELRGQLPEEFLYAGIAHGLETRRMVFSAGATDPSLPMIAHLITKRNRDSRPPCSEKLLRKLFHNRRVVAFAAENVEIGIVGVVGEVTADQ